MNTVGEILDRLWVAGVTVDNAVSMMKSLSSEETDEALRFLKSAGLLEFRSSEDTTDALPASTALFLAAMAKHHSDSIVGLPRHLRNKRMQQLAASAGVPCEAVQLAVKLGPVGIERHLAAT